MRYTENTYLDLIKQTFDFPQVDFNVKENNLFFNGVDIKKLIEKYGTPFKMTLLPKIGIQINKGKKMFGDAIKKHRYKGRYYYCYSIKSSYFPFIIEEILKHDVHLETSSDYEIEIIKELFKKHKISKKTFIICNGFKTKGYTKNIAYLINAGFNNVIPVLDNKNEIHDYKKLVRSKETINIGLRVACEEDPGFDFYTSRFGIRAKDILSFYVDYLKGNKKFKLKMLNFSMNSDIKDDAYYWNELNKVLIIYCQLKKICPELDGLNIGGGFPIKNSLGFGFDYNYMVKEILVNVKKYCTQNKVDIPNIYTEFGAFTVGESGAMIYGILGEKMQNDKELWYMIDSSFITTLPDTWGNGEKFLLLPINKWNREYHEVNLGGLTCDSHDFYTSETHFNSVFLPKSAVDDPEKLYLGFFHTGAYQDQLVGFGGIKHCLIPSPKHIVIEYNKNGELIDWVYSNEQTSQTMLKLLGYNARK